MSEQLGTPAIELLESAKRYVVMNMVWFGDTTFTEPKLTDLGKLIVNLIDDEIERQRKQEENPWVCSECGTDLYTDHYDNWDNDYCSYCGRDLDWREE